MRAEPPAPPIAHLTPEAALWGKVLEGAFLDLRDVTRWMPRHVGLERLWPPPHLSRAARSRLHEKIRSARSVLAFFSDDASSTLELICTLFDLDARHVRAVATREIDRSRLRERTECAEAWLGCAGLAG